MREKEGFTNCSRTLGLLVTGIVAVNEPLTHVLVHPRLLRRHNNKLAEMCTQGFSGLRKEDTCMFKIHKYIQYTMRMHY